MSTTEETGRTPAERRAGRRYLWEFSIGMVLYLLLLGLSIIVPAEEGTPLKAVVTLVPVLPMIWVAIAVIRHMGRMDERDRTMTLQSMSVGFGASMIAAVTVGFLRFAGFDGVLMPWAVFSCGMLAWALAGIILVARGNR